MANPISLGTIKTFEEVVVSRTLSECRKCSGRGHLVGLHRLPDNGICYRCQGSGVDPQPQTLTSTETVETSDVQLQGYALDDFDSFEAMLEAHNQRTAKIESILTAEEFDPFALLDA